MRITTLVRGMKIRKNDLLVPGHIEEIVCGRLAGSTNPLNIRSGDMALDARRFLDKRNKGGEAANPLRTVPDLSVELLPMPKLTLKKLGIEVATIKRQGAQGDLKVSRSLITVGQFVEFLESTGQGMGQFDAAKQFHDSVELVKGVTPEYINAFCQWLGRQVDQECRIPTLDETIMLRGKIKPQKSSLQSDGKGGLKTSAMFELTSHVKKIKGKQYRILFCLENGKEIEWSEADGIRGHFFNNTGFRVVFST